MRQYRITVYRRRRTAGQRFLRRFAYPPFAFLTRPAGADTRMILLPATTEVKRRRKSMAHSLPTQSRGLQDKAQAPRHRYRSGIGQRAEGDEPALCFSSAPSVSAPFPPPPHHCALREKDLAKGLRFAVGSCKGNSESAEGIKPPSASTLSHAGFPPLPQPLHDFALHGSA